VPEQAHSLAVKKLRQESGLADLLYCATSKSETRQQTNEKIITNTYLNTKCDATIYPEPLKPLKSKPVIAARVAASLTDSTFLANTSAFVSDRDKGLSPSVSQKALLQSSR
jgi:hypothetical protein